MFEQLTKALDPHAARLNETLAMQGAILHQRLFKIEDLLSDLARPDVGDLYLDLGFNGGIGAFAPKELATVPMNEYWSVQSWSALAPSAVERIIVRANKRLRLVFAVTTTLPITVSPGGDIVFLPGEVITIEGEKEGNVESSIQITRNKLPGKKIPVQMGRDNELLAPSNTHDPARDVIRARIPAGYTEVPPEVIDSSGHTK